VTPSGAHLGSPAVLLDAWDAAATVPDIARGAVVIATASGLDADALVDVPLSQVAHLAWRCLASSFGDSLDVVLTCDSCGERLELSLPLAPFVAETQTPAEPVAVPGTTLTVRPPTTRDLLAAVGTPDPAGTVLARCAAVAEGQALDDLSLAAEHLDTVAGAALAGLNSTCPACQAPAAAVLDACALLWESVADAAPRLLREVAVLASAFGWSEPEVLALPPIRRAAYLELVGQ
jgi:hypothetical protein